MEFVYLIKAMSEVIGSWLMLAIVITCIGLAARRLMGVRAIDANAIVISFWLGLAACVGFLQFWHMALPVDWRAAAIVAAAGVAGFLVCGRGALAFFNANSRRNKWTILAFVLVSIWLANRAIGPCRTYDSGLYHLSAVRWASEYPIVPGLGNLHARLAFNNVNHLLAAMLNIGFWHGKSHHLVNGLLTAMLFAQCILAASRLVRKTSGPRNPSDVFDMVLLTPAVMLAYHSWISSHSTDLPVATVSMVAASRLFRFLQSPPETSAERRFEGVAIIVLLALSVCIKLTAVVFAGMCGIVVFAFWFTRAGSPGSMSWSMLLAVVCGLLLIGPWIARNIILSGYLIFPIRAFSTGAEWRVPDILAAQHSEWIIVYARRAHGTQGWGWIGPWSESLGRELLVPTAITIAAGVAAVVLKFYGRRFRAGRSAGWFVALAAAAGVGFWFFTAPDIRFGFWLLWIIAATMAAMVLRPLLAVGSQRTIVAVMLCGVLLAACNMKKFFQGPGPDGGYYPTPTAKMRPFVTDSGLVVYTPAGSDQCWDAELPCTPEPFRELRLRREGDLSGGFMLPSLRETELKQYGLPIRK